MKNRRSMLESCDGLKSSSLDHWCRVAPLSFRIDRRSGKGFTWLLIAKKIVFADKKNARKTLSRSPHSLTTVKS